MFLFDGTGYIFCFYTIRKNEIHTGSKKKKNLIKRVIFTRKE